VVYGILEDDAGNIIIGTTYGLTILKGGLGVDKETFAKEGVEHFNEHAGFPIKDVSNNYIMLIDRRGFVWAGTGDKLVRFDFVGIETARPSLVRYQYMLEGSDKHWGPLSN